MYNHADTGKEHFMSTPIVMPKQGQSVERCVILEWMKKKGDTVKAGDILFSYETDKAAFDFESPASGVLLDTFFKADDDVPVMTTVAVIGEVGESVEQYRPAAGVAPSAEKAAPSQAKVETAPATQPEAETASMQGPASSTSGAASPRARKKAQERGVDLASVAGTGPHARIIERDVLAHAPTLTRTASARMSAEGLFAPGQGSGPGGRVLAADLSGSRITGGGAIPPTANDTFSEVKLSNMRKIIGSRMFQSLQQTAQLTMNSFADATALLAWRKQLKARGKELSLPEITVTDLVAMAVARTLSAFPELNCLYKDEKVIRYDHVHLAMAVDTPRGLMVPVVRFADLAPLGALSSKLKELAGQCREGSINPDLLSGGTITISNLGMFGVESFTPILNPPQVAILGVTSISPRPVADENNGYVIRPHIGFSLTIDHRVVDGGPGARFLKALCDNIAHIDFMLTIW
jgi:pyruvate dehydrogenase E2 component (dihydrolipoamide acetyltransferase)